MTDTDDTTTAGRAGAVRGMRRARDHAERSAPGWQGRARVVLLSYLATLRGESFIAPALRQYAERIGLDQPPNKRAWGAVLLSAASDGLLVADGFTTYGDASMHTQSVRKWRAADAGRAAA